MDPVTVSTYESALRAWLWLRPGLLAAARGLAVALLAVAVNPVLFVLTVVSLALLPALGIGFAFFPVMVAIVRWRANLARRLAGYSGVDIPSPYRPIPPGAWFGTWRRFRHTVTEAATWRDIAWLIPGALAGAGFGLTAFVIPVYGLEGVLLITVVLWLALDWWGYVFFWPLDNVFEAALTVPIGALLLVLGLAAARWLTWLEASFARFFLAPNRTAELSDRVRHLADTRADTVDAQAAELRRIERDLHDGAQARLVSVSMNIGLAEELMKRDPEAASRLLAEAREASGQALTDLRHLVRGIHPPVLAERGLIGAIRALALAVPLRVLVDVDLSGEVPRPMESAVYFGVAEVLANVTKHSGARTAWIRLWHEGGRLRVEVGDDGYGGADPTRGSGLVGIGQRLAAFDGIINVSSPAAGPTIVTMELPCVLSSPKTMPSSGTA